MSWLLLKGSRNQTFTDPKLFGDGANGHGFGQIPSLFAVEDGAGPAEFFALFPGAVDAHGDAFPDQIPLQLRHGTENGEDHSADRCRRVAGFGYGNKATHGPSVPASTARPARAYANAA